MHEEGFQRTCASLYVLSVSPISIYIYCNPECDPIQCQGSIEWAQLSLLASCDCYSLLCESSPLLDCFVPFYCFHLVLHTGFPVWSTHRTGTAQTTTSIYTCGGKGLKRQYVLDRFELWSETIRVTHFYNCLLQTIHLINDLDGPFLFPHPHT